MSYTSSSCYLKSDRHDMRRYSITYRASRSQLRTMAVSLLTHCQVEYRRKRQTYETSHRAMHVITCCVASSGKMSYLSCSSSSTSNPVLPKPCVLIVMRQGSDFPPSAMAHSSWSQQQSYKDFSS